LYKFIVNKITFVGFREGDWGDRPTGPTPAERFLQNTSSSNYLNVNNYRTVFCNNYWNVTWLKRSTFSMKQKIASKL